MKSPRDKQFYVYKDGSPMQVEDLIEALRQAISIMAKQFNFVSVSEKRISKAYRRKLEVLEKIKESYELAVAMDKKPKLETVKGRGK